MSLPDENSLLKKEFQAPEIEVEIEGGGGVEVVVEDDTPKEDRGRKALPEGEAEPTEAEMEEYSEAVKKRISKMRHGLHDERRAKESATRERDEAVAIAQRIFEEKKAIEARMNLGEEAYLYQNKEKVESDIVAAKRAYKEAYDIGDADKMADAQEALADLAVARNNTVEWSRQQVLYKTKVLWYKVSDHRLKHPCRNQILK
jgi:TPR repeat protein